MSSDPSVTTRTPPRGEIAPAVVLIGDVALKVLEWAEHMDFLLSVREEKLATILELYRDFGWWIVAFAAAIWFLYEYRRRKKDPSATGSIGGLVASVAFVSFLLGSFITVKATGTLPNIFLNYGGQIENGEGRCTADIDPSRLTGFAEDYRLVLLCGIMDPSVDPLDDTRIAVSSSFHITDSKMVGIVASLGKLGDAAKDQVERAEHARSSTAGPPDTTTTVQFQMWHALAIIPKDVQSQSIKKASDIKQLGGRVLTEPVGSWGSTMQIPFRAAQTRTATEPRTP
jgi:hypothetical protein